MSLLLSKTKSLWILLALYSGPTWSPVQCVSVKTSPKTPATIETQAKFFQDFFSVQLSPYKIEFGHVCEDPNNWEQRYEKKDYKNHRDMGKVRWGDKKGGYGEHYWDLNHAGHANKFGDDDYNGSNSDDGSYHERDHEVPSSNYESPSDHSYDSDDYDPEKSSYEESGRAKRAHPRQKQEKNHKARQAEEKIQPDSRKYKQQQQEEQQEEQQVEQKVQKQQQESPSHNVEKYYDDSDEYEEVPKKPKHSQYKHTHDDSDAANEPKETKKQIVLVVKEKEEDPNPYFSQKQTDYTKYVPYEGGAGVRQHYQPEATVAASIPRLFLEPLTGHVVDRATGQAYVLQPIATHNRN